MNIFFKKPLSLILCIMLGGFSLFMLLDTEIATALFVLLLLLTTILAPRRVSVKATAIALLALCFSMVAGLLYPTWFRAYKHYRGEVEIEALVTDVDRSLVYETELDLKTVSIDGNGLSRYKLKLTLPPDEASAIRRGSTVRLRGELSAFEGSASFDAEAYYRGQGFSAEITSPKELTVIGYKQLPDFSSLRDLVARRAVMLAGREPASLFIALFTGDRSGLSSVLRLSFTRIGINHVLALSGMHLAILSALLMKVTRLLRLGRRSSRAVCIIAVLFYMAMTGFSPSVTRAGVMLAITGILYARSASHDSITSLSVAVFTICLFEPYAIGDLGLWLSAFATLGVIEAGDISRRRRLRSRYVNESRSRRFVRTLISGAALTLFAMSATLVISVFSFSGISPLSIITTPIFSFLAEICIYVGLAMLAIGSIIPIGRLLTPIYELTLISSRLMADGELAYFSTEPLAVKIAAAVSAAAFFLFLILKLRHRIVAASLVSALLVSTLVIAGAMTGAAKNTDRLLYYASENAECLILRSEGELAAVDLSSGSRTANRLLYEALYSATAVEADKLVFAYYSANLPEKALGFTSSVLTRTVLLPRPENAEEALIAEEVEAAMNSVGVEVRYYGANGVIIVGKLSLYAPYRSLYGEGAATSVITVNTGGENIAYLSSGILENKDGEAHARSALADAESVILGLGGKSYREELILDVRHSQIRQMILSGESLWLTQSARIFYDEIGTEFLLRPKYAELLPDR